MSPHSRCLVPLLLRFFVCTAAVAALAQEDAVFRAGVDVVNIIATVRDKQGHLVTDLDKNDFKLKEDGKPQEIQYFSRQTDLPLTIGILVDTSMSQRRILEDERSAGHRFFDRVLDETKDQAFVISFDIDVELLQDLTNSKRALDQSLEELQAPSRPGWSGPRGNQQFPGGGVPGGTYPGGRRRGGGRGGQRPRDPSTGGRPAGIGTVLYDAVFLAADEVLREQSGRKAIVLISDGVDMGSKLDKDEAIEAAHRADVVIYGIHYADEGAYGGRSQGRRPPFGMGGPGAHRKNGEKVLRKLSETTGGRLYKVSENMTLAAIFDQIEEELRSQYSIGYTSDDVAAGEGFRKIEVRAKGKGLRVYARSGYYPASK